MPGIGACYLCGMAWSEKKKASTDASDKITLGRGVFRNCDACGGTLRADEFEANHQVCPDCQHHFHLPSEAWVELLIDEGSWVEHDADLKSGDPLGFKDSKRYLDRVAAAIEKSGVSDAFISGSGELDGMPVQLGCFVFRFMGGSMGSVVGEKITRVFERGAELDQPVIILTSSGGARMQEGALSLMQMAKTVAARARLQRAGVPFLSVLLNPSTGGVAASFALQGDVNVSEPGALIGFAGPRVIEDTIGQTLPDGFQRSEFLLEHGILDLISVRSEMRATLSTLLKHLAS